MRGKLYCFACGAGGDGITPADAGKTCRRPCSDRREEDHPRGCGENVLDGTEKDETLGSPPRMRGKRGYVPVGGHDGGITPADAGKTRQCHLIKALGEDHPRGCGENAIPHTRILAKIGSPPRMRGKPRERVKVQRVNGITPADAGKTG